MVAGVFDSGVGGLTVVKSLLTSKIFKKIIYFGDTARVPYGSKDKNTIIRYSLEALEFFENFKIDIFITACNSVSAYAIDDLRSSSKIPVIGVIESGVLALNKLSNIDKNSKILIIGTKATINSNKYVKLLNSYGYKNIISKATPLFVPIVEEGLFQSEILNETMKYYFKDIENPDIIILGCTHFPLIAKEIATYYPNSKLIHSGDAIVEYLRDNKLYDLNVIYENIEIEFFATENPKGLKEVAKMWLYS